MNRAWYTPCITCHGGRPAMANDAGLQGLMPSKVSLPKTEEQDGKGVKRGAQAMGWRPGGGLGGGGGATGRGRAIKLGRIVTRGGQSGR